VVSFDVRSLLLNLMFRNLMDIVDYYVRKIIFYFYDNEENIYRIKNE
jgi:hypothetical protein